MLFLVESISRLDYNTELNGRLIGLNERVKTLCKKMKVRYIEICGV